MSSDGVVIVSVVLVGVLLIVAVWQGLRAWQTAASRGHDSEVRVVAETAAGAAVVTADKLTEITETLADIKTRIAAIEKMLKDVE
jgi:hypothetical protein